MRKIVCRKITKEHGNLYVMEGRGSKKQKREKSVGRVKLCWKGHMFCFPGISLVSENYVAVNMEDLTRLIP